MTKKILVIAAIIVVAGGFWYLTRPADDANGGKGGGATTNHVEGNADAAVELIEYGDFQCPACGRFYPVLKEVKEKYKANVKFVFRHFPLDSIHPNARAAHRAAEAAGMQGKFFDMHDKLYEQQQVWSGEANPYGTFKGFAEQLGLDIAKYESDYKSLAVNDAINNDVAAGQALKASSTPTFVLNGKKLDDETMQSISFSEGLQGAVDDFSKLIDDALAEKNTTASATPAASATPTPTATEASPTPTAEPSTDTQ